MPDHQPPAERFAGILRSLSQAVMARTGWALTLTLIALINDRLREINQRVARIVARLREGRDAPRRQPARRPAAVRHPRRSDPLPKKSAWLLPLISEAACASSQLEQLFRDPEMQALLAAAPASLRRPVRSLCRMLGAEPPPALALPAKPRPPRPARPQPPPKPPLEQPAWMRIGPPRKPWSPARIRGLSKRS